MKLGYISLVVLFNPLTIQAAPLSLQAQIIGSQGKLEPDRKVYSGQTAAYSMQAADEIDEAVTAPGFGLHMSYLLNPESRLGGEVSWVNYDQGNAKPQYQDAALALNASYDVYRVQIFALYGLGGFSYHHVDPQDRTLAQEKSSISSADLVNYDLGIGGRVDVSPQVQIDVSYRYSDSLQKDDVTIDNSTSRGTIRGELKDLGLVTNELLASVGYQF